MRVEVARTGNVGVNVCAACLAQELTKSEFDLLADLEKWPEAFRLMCRSTLKNFREGLI